MPGIRRLQPGYKAIGGVHAYMMRIKNGFASVQDVKRCLVLIQDLITLRNKYLLNRRICWKNTSI